MAEGGTTEQPPQFQPPPVPLANPAAALAWLDTYLAPKSLGGQGHRAHQFTINGFTYPFIRHYNVAGVPDIPRDRRYDMYAGLELARAGDLLVFFQSDPHPATPPLGLGPADSRRGLRGLYRVVSAAYRTPVTLTDTVSGVGYTLLDKCPSCKTPHSDFKEKCPLCNTPYPPSGLYTAAKKPLLQRVIGSQLRIEPVWAFERAVSDERAYADLAEAKSGLIWIGRHDNAQGPGKGSSIRHLLPEEAHRILELLLTEPDQRVGPSSAHAPPSGASLCHPCGTAARMVPLTGVRAKKVAREDELYFVLARQIADAGSSLRGLLTGHLTTGVGWDDLEYVSSTFPWGYTAGTADFVIAFRSATGRRFAVIFECKMASSHDAAVLQSMLYVERTAQVLAAACPPAWLPTAGDTLEILPVVIACGLKKPNSVASLLAVPRPYSFTRDYLGGNSITCSVRSPLFATYNPPAGAGAFGDADGFVFQPLPPASWRLVSWTPPRGAVGTPSELEWIRTSSWSAARRAAGI